MKKFQRMPLVLFIIFLLFSVNGCTGKADQNIPSPSSESDLELEDNIISALGEVVPEKWTNLSFQSGGYIENIPVTPGQYVTLNTILARVNDVAQQTAFASAESVLAGAEANLERLEELEASQSELDVATKSLEAARAGLQLAQQNLDFTVLKAPYSGVVVDIFLHNFETASPGQPVVLLADLTNLVVETTDLGEVDVIKIQVGDPVAIVFDALPDVTTSGKVIHIALHPESGAGVYYTVKIKMDKIPEGLRWGMSAFIEIEVSE